MTKLHEIVQNAQLEQNFINYIGFQYLELHWQDNIDPQLPYAESEFEFLYEEMKNGALQDLENQLQCQHGLRTDDPNFYKLLDAAASIILARHGIQAIIASAREFLHDLQSPEDEEELEGPTIECELCHRQAIALSIEDLPAELLGTADISVGRTYGFCNKCKVFVM